MERHPGDPDALLGRLSFGRFTVDGVTGQLLRDGAEVPLQPLAWQLLALLAAHPGVLFSRDDLNARLWPGVRVTDDSLSQLVSRVRRVLGADEGLLCTVPRRGYRFDGEVRAEAAPRRTVARWPDRFVGRAADLERLRALAETERLLVLTGPGGVGKTRLAHRLAEDLGDAWIVDLQSAADAAGVEAAVGAALGLDPAVLGVELDRRGSLLVVLDNFEHLVAAAGQTVGRWLVDAPQARFVVTSRVVLGLRGERLHRVDPLPADEAAALFRDRTGLTGDDPAIDALVRAVDSLPLAIELAAARARVVPPAVLLARLSLPVLSGGSSDRHASLERVLDASWELLAAGDRGALAALAVLRSRFDLDAAEAVLGEDPLDRLQVLVDRSWIRAEADGFSILAIVREYVAGRAEPPADAVVRHGQWFARLGTPEARVAARRDPELRRRRAAALDDLCAACRAAAGRGDPENAALAGVAAADVLLGRGPVGLAVELLELVEPGTSGRLRRVVLQRLANALQQVERVPEAVRCNEEAAAIAREAGDAAGEGMHLLDVARCQLQAGAFDDGERLATVALDRLRAGGDRRNEGIALLTLATAHYRKSNLLDAVVFDRQAVAVFTALGDDANRAIALSNLGIATTHRAPGEGIALQQDALALFQALGDAVRAAVTTAEIGTSYARRGSHAEAEEWLARGLALLERVGAARDLARTLTNLGALRVQSGRAGEAVDPLHRALRMEDAIGHRAGAGEALALLASAAVALGRPEEAEIHAERALAVAAESGEPYVVSRARMARAELRVAQARLAEADEDLVAAEPGLRVGWNLVDLAELLIRRAEIARARGEDPAQLIAEAAATAGDAGVVGDSPIVAALARLG